MVDYDLIETRHSVKAVEKKKRHEKQKYKAKTKPQMDISKTWNAYQTDHHQETYKLT